MPSQIQTGVTVFGDPIWEDVAQAEALLSEAYGELGLDLNMAPEILFNNVYDVLNILEAKHRQSPIDGVVTGSISERICELGLQQARVSYHKPAQHHQHLADFILEGLPHNVFVSVKSFKAKERLMASGYGYPVIGFGFFNDPKEWKNERRVRTYLSKGFISIYMPESLLANLPTEVQTITNMNGKFFLRELYQFPGNLRAAISDNKIDYYLL